MPRYNVEHKGKWACFSSVVDDFITEFTSKGNYEEWRKDEYGKDYYPLEQCNRMALNETVFFIRLNRTHEEAVKCLIKSGLSESESEKIMLSMEEIHYMPKLNNGKYYCPNCDNEVELNQKECNNETCCLEFVWKSQ